ncbi:hypothetical protein [Methanolobus profundi]|nr:hypothetical protein [Methanolobus profundi]
MLFLVSIIGVAGTSAALEEQTVNSLEVSDIISISNVTDIYFDELARDENVSYNYRSLLECWNPDGSKVLVLTRYAPLGEPELDALYFLNADGTEPREIIATRNNTMERSLELTANEHFEIARWNSAGDHFAFYGNVVNVSDTMMVVGDDTFIGAAGVSVVGIADINRNSVEVIGVRNLSNISIWNWIDHEREFEWEPNGTDAIMILNGDIWVVQKYDSSSNQIIDSEKGVSECMWNHKGDQIAFVEDGLWTTDRYTGDDLKQLASNADRLIGWSLDDSMIYYSSYEDESCSHFVVQLNDSKITKISTGSLSDYMSIGPDGRLLFTNSTYQDGKLISSCLNIADADGTHINILDENASEYAYLISKASWSPKGDKIATAFNIIDANGSEKHEIVLGDTFSWHPSGDYIAFEVDHPVGDMYATKVYVANSDGSGVTQVSPDDNYSYSLNDWLPHGSVSNDWSPDGSRMLIKRNGLNHSSEELLVVRFSGFDEIMSLDFKDYTTVRKDVHISVTSMSQPVQHALITLDGREIGVTDENGSFTYYIIDEPGTHMLNASKEGYLDSGKELTVYGDAYSSVKDDEISDQVDDTGGSMSTILTPIWDWLNGITGN